MLPRRIHARTGDGVLPRHRLTKPLANGTLTHKHLTANATRARPARRDESSAGGAGLPQPPRCSPSGMQMGSDSPEQLHSTTRHKRRGRKFD